MINTWLLTRSKTKLIAYIFKTILICVQTIPDVGIDKTVNLLINLKQTVPWDCMNTCLLALILISLNDYVMNRCTRFDFDFCFVESH